MLPKEFFQTLGVVLSAVVGIILFAILIGFSLYYAPLLTLSTLTVCITIQISICIWKENYPESYSAWRAKWRK